MSPLGILAFNWFTPLVDLAVQRDKDPKPANIT